MTRAETAGNYKSNRRGGSVGNGKRPSEDAARKAKEKYTKETPGERQRGRETCMRGRAEDCRKRREQESS